MEERSREKAVGSSRQNLKLWRSFSAAARPCKRKRAKKSASNRRYLKKRNSLAEKSRLMYSPVVRNRLRNAELSEISQRTPM